MSGFIKWWYGGDAGQTPDDSTTFNADGFTDFSTGIPLGGTLLRTLVNVGIYSITKQPGTDAPLFDPEWYAQGVIFNLAITSTDGFGVPINPLIPDPTQDDQALAIWQASLFPRLEHYIVTADGQNQVVRWLPDTGIRMESFARRGPYEGDARKLWLTWSVTDPTGYFNTDTDELQSYCGGRVQTWSLYQQPNE